MWFLFIPFFIFLWTRQDPFKISGVNDKYDDLFLKFGKKNGVSPKMLKAIGLNESWLGKYTDYEEKGGTSGLMHIKLSTAQQFKDYSWWDFSDYNPWQSQNQIEAASLYLKYLKKLFNGDTKKVVMSYNQGEGNTKNGKRYAIDNGYWDRYLRNEKRLG